jgi:hypothetical protein
MRNYQLLTEDNTMPLYTSSKGEQIDTSTTNEKYIERALTKARETGNENNMQALEEELIIRAGNNE